MSYQNNRKAVRLNRNGFFCVPNYLILQHTIITT